METHRGSGRNMRKRHRVCLLLLPFIPAAYRGANRLHDGSRRPSPFNLLGLMNAVAGRTFSGEPIYIEQMPNIVESPMNPDSPVTAYTVHLDEMAECNVPWP